MKALYGRGFTLIEILVVVSLMAILAGIVTVNAADAGRQGRDTERQSDLRLLQNAVELYRQKYGQYPATLADVAPEYITTVVRDPRTNNAYDYETLVVNPGNRRLAYKITGSDVEADTVDIDHEFYPCRSDCPTGACNSHDGQTYGVYGGSAATQSGTINFMCR